MAKTPITNENIQAISNALKNLKTGITLETAWINLINEVANGKYKLGLNDYQIINDAFKTTNLSSISEQVNTHAGENGFPPKENINTFVKEVTRTGGPIHLQKITELSSIPSPTPDNQKEMTECLNKFALSISAGYQISPEDAPIINNLKQNENYKQSYEALSAERKETLNTELSGGNPAWVQTLLNKDTASLSPAEYAELEYAVKHDLSDDLRAKVQAKIADYDALSPNKEQSASPLTDETQQNADPAAETTEKENKTEEQKASADNKETEVREPVADEETASLAEETKKEETLSAEERNTIISEVLNTTDLKVYLAQIDPKISQTAIETSMALETPKDRAAALVDPDNLLVAYDWYEKNGKPLNELNDVVAASLENYISHPDDITPDNAFALLTLSSRLPEESAVRQSFEEKLALALKHYDNEHFGTLSAEQLSTNYNAAIAETNILLQEDSLTGYQLLNDYSFTNDNGKPLPSTSRWFNKRTTQNQIKEAVYKAAAEMTAEQLAKTSLPEDAAARRKEIKRLMQENITALLYTPDGKKQFSESEITGRIGAAMARSDSFKKRAEIKHKNSPFASAVQNRLNKLDAHFTKLWPKTYPQAKKWGKVIARAGIGGVKNTLLFTGAAAAGPVFVGGLMAYNTLKQWKSLSPMLKDPNISKTEKGIQLFGAAFSTATSALMMGSGLSAALSAVGIDPQAAAQAGANMMISGARIGVSAITMALPAYMQKRQLNADIKTYQSKMKQLQNGTLTEEDLKTARNKKIDALTCEIAKLDAKRTKPGFINSCANKLLGRNNQRKKLAALLIAAQSEPTTLAGLIKAEKEAIAKKKMKNEETTIKLVSTAIGVAVGQQIAHSQPLQDFQHAASGVLHDTHDNTPSVEPAANEHPQAAADKPDFSPHNTPEGTTTLHDRSVYDPDGLLAQRAAPEGTFDNTPAPDDISGIRPNENLSAAKEADSSGVTGKSAYDHAHQVMEYLQRTNAADANIDVTATTDGLAEHLGKQAGMSAMSCTMAPHALQNVLHLDLPDGQAPTTHNMSQYLATHDLTPEQMQALQKFNEENFTNGQWHGNGCGAAPEHTQPQHRHTPPVTARTEHVPPADNTQKSTITFEPLNNHPKEQYIVLEKTPEPQEVRPVYHEAPAEEVIYNDFGHMSTAQKMDYCARMGFQYHPALSQGLNPGPDGTGMFDMIVTKIPTPEDIATHQVDHRVFRLNQYGELTPISQSLEGAQLNQRAGQTEWYGGHRAASYAASHGWNVHARVGSGVIVNDGVYENTKMGKVINTAYGIAETARAACDATHELGHIVKNIRGIFRS